MKKHFTVEEELGWINAALNPNHPWFDKKNYDADVKKYGQVEIDRQITRVKKAGLWTEKKK